MNEQKAKVLGEWSFTDEPDWARICREVESTGAAFAVVRVKTFGFDKTFTIANHRARYFNGNADASKASLIADFPSVKDEDRDSVYCWYRYEGDWTDRFKKRNPVVEVKAYQ